MPLLNNDLAETVRAQFYCLHHSSFTTRDGHAIRRDADQRRAVYGLSVRPKDSGKVFVVYEDDDQDAIPYDKREYALVADSFTDIYKKVIENYDSRCC